MMKAITAAMALVLVAFAHNASAATLIFFDDLATNPSLNQGIAFDVSLRADGSVRGQLVGGAYPVSGTARTDLHTFGADAFGINLASGVTAAVGPNRFIPPWPSELDKVVGPYGTFDFVLDGSSYDTLHSSPPIRN